MKGGTRVSEPTTRIRRRGAGGGELRQRSLPARKRGKLAGAARGRFLGGGTSTRVYDLVPSDGRGSATPVCEGDGARSSAPSGGEVASGGKQPVTLMPFTSASTRRRAHLRPRRGGRRREQDGGSFTAGRRFAVKSG